jgi:hypothetical protein
LDGQRFTFLGRRLPIALVFILLVLAAASAALYYYLLDPNRYIARAEQLARDATGLPVSIEGIHWAFNPAPVMVFTNVHIGDEDFGAKVVNIRAEVDLFTLVQGRAHVPEVRLSGAQLFLPEGFGDTGERFSAVINQGRNSEAEEKTDQGAEVGVIAADGVRVFRDGEPWANMNVHIAGVTAPNIAIDATLNARGPEAEGGVLETSLRFDKSDNAISGTVALRGPALALLPELGKQDLAVDLQARIEGSASTQIAAEVTGSFATDTFEQQGTVHGMGYWKDGLFIANDVEAISQDCEIRFDSTVTPGKEVAFEIFRAHVGTRTLGLLAAAWSPEAVNIELTADANVTLTEVLGAYPLGEGQRPRFDRGDIAFDGISILPAGEAQWPPLHEAEGHASLSGEHIAFDLLKARGLALTGAAGQGEDGAMGIDMNGRVDLAALELGGLEALQQVKSMEGGIVVERLRIAAPVEEDDSIQINFTGRAEEAGFTFQLPDSREPLTAKGINGGIGFDGEVLTLTELKGDGFLLNGSVHVAGDAERRYSLTGYADLAHPIVQVALASAPLRNLSGRMELARLEGVFGGEGSGIEQTTIEGTIKDASFTAKVGDSTLKASKVNGSISTPGKEVVAEISMQTDLMGPVKWDGRLDIAAMDLKGALRLNVARAASAFVAAARENETLRKALDAYGEADIALSAELPRGKRAPKIHLQSKGAPPLEANVAFASLKGGGYALDAVTLDTTLPLKDLELPGTFPVHAAGSAQVALRRESSASGYTVAVGLDEADLKVGDYLHKRPGQNLELTLSGAKDWAPESIAAQLLDQPLNFRMTASGVESNNFDIDLARLSPLFPEDVKTRGRVQGSFTSQPPSASIALSDVTLALSPEVRVESVNGGIAYAGGIWTFNALRVAGADSDFILDAGLRDGRWTGGISGQRINMNALMEMQRAYDALTGGSGGTPGSSPASTEDSGGISGELQIQLNEVLYQRALLTGLQGRLIFTPARYELIELQAYLGEGVAQGQVVYQPARGAGIAMADVELTLRTVDAAVIDGLLPNPRGMKGSVDADIDLSVPLPPDTPPYMGVTGKIEFQAKNGTYGSAGGADRLLSVLRATEIFRLTFPGLGEESGLAFNRSNCTMIAQRGVVAIEEFQLNARAYAIQAAGVIDFPEDTITAEGQFDMLDAVTTVAEAVPIVGGAVGGLKGTASVAFSVKGSPFEPQFSARPGINPLQNTKDGLKGVFKDVTNVKGLFGLRRNKK